MILVNLVVYDAIVSAKVSFCVKKKWKGGQGGSGEGKNRSEKGHLTQKRPEIADEGVLEPPKPPKNKDIYNIL